MQPLINRDVHSYRHNIEELSIDIDRMAEILRSKEAKDGGKLIRGKSFGTFQTQEMLIFESQLDIANVRATSKRRDSGI